MLYFVNKEELEEFVSYTLDEQDAQKFLNVELDKESLKKLFQLVAEEAFNSGLYSTY